MRSPVGTWAACTRSARTLPDTATCRPSVNRRSNRSWVPETATRNSSGAPLGSGSPVNDTPAALCSTITAARLKSSTLPSAPVPANCPGSPCAVHSPPRRTTAGTSRPNMRATVRWNALTPCSDPADTMNATGRCAPAASRNAGDAMTSFASARPSTVTVLPSVSVTEKRSPEAVTSRPIAPAGHRAGSTGP